MRQNPIRRPITMARTASLLVAIALLAAGCSASPDAVGAPPDASDSALRQRDVLQAGADADAVSKLAIDVRDVSAIGRTVRFRGRATNHYDEVVDGVVYRLRLFSTDGARTLRTEYSDIDTEIAAGGTDSFEMELQSMYFATVPRFVIDAIPQRLGGRDFEPPADWER